MDTCFFHRTYKLHLDHTLPTFAFNPDENKIKTAVKKGFWKAIQFRDPLIFTMGLICLGILLAQQPFSQTFSECADISSDQTGDQTYNLDQECFTDLIASLQYYVDRLSIPISFSLTFTFFAMLDLAVSGVKKLIGYARNPSGFFAADHGSSAETRGLLAAPVIQYSENRMLIDEIDEDVDESKSEDEDLIIPINEP